MKEHIPTKMKNYSVSFAVKHPDGTIVEHDGIPDEKTGEIHPALRVNSVSINGALAKALSILRTENIDGKFEIYAIGVMDEEVFI